MALYYVSGIWTNNDDVITHLNIHLVPGSTVNKAVKCTLTQAITLIEAGHELYTCNWNYSSSNWTQGAEVHVVQERNQKYLRSNHDNVQRDNLDNMLPMANLGL